MSPARGMPPVIVAGAGLAGLTCALDLQAAGIPVTLLEARDVPGGRLASRRVDGFCIDRGFQVLLAAYPALLRRIRLDDLYPRYFRSALLVAQGGRVRRVGHPLYAPRSLPATVRSGLVGPRDAAALARLVLPSLGLGDGPLPAASVSARIGSELAGMSREFEQQVLRPFFGGISLDPTLRSDATFLRFVLRTMAVGRVFLPARGVAALPALLAGRLAPGVLRLGTPVEALLREDGRVVGVRAGGEEVIGRAVVVAVEAPAAQKLTGLPLPVGARSCTTVYFASDRPLYSEPALLVNGGDGLVNHVAQLSAVAAEYAPAGRHLLAATILQDVDAPDDQISRDALADLQGWYPAAKSWAARAVAVERVPYAQFDQPPGIYRRLPGPKTETPGLFLAGEYLHSSSVQGALRGGELAAAAVLQG